MKNKMDEEVYQRLKSELLKEIDQRMFVNESAYNCVDKKLFCQKCNYRWNPRVTNPLACPNCKSFKWNRIQNPGSSNESPR